MLVPLNLQRLSSADLIDFVRQHITSVNEAGVIISDPIILKYLETLEKDADELQSSEKSSQSNVTNQLIFESDKVRDRALSVFRRLMQVYELSEDNSPEAQAYEVLNNMWQKYETLQYMSLSVETEGIDNLLFDLSTSRYSSHVATLDLDEAVEKIRSTNEDFKTIYNEQAATSSSTTSANSYDARELRIELMKTIRLYSEYVYALTKSAEHKEMRDLLNVLNDNRSHFVRQLTNRHAGDAQMAE